MKRLHLFEFEDQPWLPGALRNLQTDFLRHMSAVLHLYEPVVPLIDKVLEQMSSRRIVDLCSGAAGPWEQLLETEWKVTVTLTDRYPNRAAFARAQAHHAPRLDYWPEPVDARRLPAHLAGMRILFNGFHHFRPVDAQALLQDAVVRQEAIGIFEIAERTPRTSCKTSRPARAEQSRPPCPLLPPSRENRNSEWPAEGTLGCVANRVLVVVRNTPLVRALVYRILPPTLFTASPTWHASQLGSSSQPVRPGSPTIVIVPWQS